MTVDYEDMEPASSLWQQGDMVDARDVDTGAWFEATIRYVERTSEVSEEETVKYHVTFDRFPGIETQVRCEFVIVHICKQ